MIDGLEILVETVITGNLVLIQGLGLYALTRYTKSVPTAVKAGSNTVVGMLLGALILWLLGDIVPTSPTSQIGFYVLVGFVAAATAPRLTRRDTSSEYHVVDTALIGLLLIMATRDISGVENLWFALGSSLGYFIVLIVMATIRQRLELAPIPKAFQGIPIVLITAGIMGIALLGFWL
ncbi:MAG TPA: Rnf-Nqr domain containing protein [Limnochordia bacterium]|nr:Rnf-Nqr domain containing protein [Limnochordia bacterium]